MIALPPAAHYSFTSGLAAGRASSPCARTPAAPAHARMHAHRRARAHTQQYTFAHVNRPSHQGCILVSLFLTLQFSFSLFQSLSHSTSLFLTLPLPHSPFLSSPEPRVWCSTPASGLILSCCSRTAVITFVTQILPLKLSVLFLNATLSIYNRLIPP